MSDRDHIKETNLIKNNFEEYLNFIHSKFSFIHNSNFFFRDLYYATRQFLEERAVRTSSTGADSVARLIAEDLEIQGIFKKIDHQSWTLNYPRFAIPRVEKKAVK